MTDNKANQQDEEILKFDKLNSSIDSTFWQEFGRRKINEYKLSEDVIDINGTFTCGIDHKNVNLPAKIFLNNNCFNINNNDNLPQYYFQIPGELINSNKIETFKKIDKKKLLHDISIKIINDIRNKNNIINDPSLLYRFAIISYSDLKKHKYIYWCCFPAIIPKNYKIITYSNTKLQNYFKNKNKHQMIRNNYIKFYNENDVKQSLLFIVNKDLSISLLSEYSADDVLMFGYIDNSNLVANPCWFLRNILLFISFAYNLFNKKILVFCARNLNNNLINSLIFSLSVNIDTSCVTIDNILDLDNIRCVGWEKNAANKKLPKKIDLSKLLDPVILCKQSVNLNLKLMKWRRLPSLNLNAISSLKCLLCGAGTLGTYVSRQLLAWGCNNITFIDNGKISYSNPVRQCLYTYNDCINNLYKADVAAKAIKDIYPVSNCSGYNLSIPMPGHYCDKSMISSTKKEYELFEKLVIENDVIFLLTDSRESRWLPTLLSKVYNKIVINIALGFDSYLIMRHSDNNNNLGCYFCSDVVAPTDSISDRSLDQQCTVTRPGLASIASGIGVELLISYIQHINNDNNDDDNSKLICKPIPHQIRGYLFNFKNMLLSVQSYDKCPACSDNIINIYKEQKWDFILKVLNEPKYLEKVSGLDKLKDDMDLNDIDIDWDDDDDGDGDDDNQQPQTDDKKDDDK